MISGGQTTGSTGAPAAPFDKTPYLDKAKATCAGDPEQQRCETVKMPGYFQEACDSITDLANQKSCYEELTTTIETLGKDQTITWSAGKYPDVAKKRNELKTKFKVTAPADPKPDPITPKSVPESEQGLRISVGVGYGFGGTSAARPIEAVSGTTTPTTDPTCNPDYPCDDPKKVDNNKSNGASDTTATRFPYRVSVDVEYDTFTIEGQPFALGVSGTYLYGQTDDPNKSGNSSSVLVGGIHASTLFQISDATFMRLRLGVERSFIPDWSSLNLNPELGIDRGSQFTADPFWAFKAETAWTLPKVPPKLRFVAGLSYSPSRFLDLNVIRIGADKDDKDGKGGVQYENAGFSTHVYLGVKYQWGGN